MNTPDIEQATAVVQLAEALVAFGVTVASAAVVAVRAYRARWGARRAGEHLRRAPRPAPRPRPRNQRRRRR